MSGETKLGQAVQWNVIRPQKGMKSWHTLQHWLDPESVMLRESLNREGHVLCEVKPIETESISVAARGWWAVDSRGVSECQGLRGGLWGDKSILELDGGDNYVT